MLNICGILGTCPEAQARPGVPGTGSKGPAPSGGAKGPGGIGGGVYGGPADSPRNKNQEQDKVTLGKPETGPSQPRPGGDSAPGEPELPNFAAAYGA